VIIGENNSGKSAIIDAIRLALSLGDMRRELYVNASDFHRSTDGRSATEIQIDLTFDDLTEYEEGALYDLLVPGDPNTAELHLRYEMRTLAKGLDKLAVDVWGGAKEGQPVSSHTLSSLNHLYLGPLRDASRHLRPGRDNRLGQLIRKIVTAPVDRERIVGHMRQANDAILRDEKVNCAATIVNQNLASMEGPRLAQKVAITMTPPDFDRVADSMVPFLAGDPSTPMVAAFPVGHWTEFLQTVAADERQALERIAQRGDTEVRVNVGELTTRDACLSPSTVTRLLLGIGDRLSLDLNGMGYNNIIYMATAMGDLQQFKSLDLQSYNALLVEEPEAHLHPQLQRLVCRFFEAVCDPGCTETSVQVFVTSHSPTLTCKVPLDCLVILHESPEGVRTLPLGSITELTPQDKADLQRYLDVTRSQLLFAKGVLLVEGISEALLMPVLAQRLGYPLDENAVEVVYVGSTSFGPFARLFRSDTANTRFDVPAVIITDDDRCTEGDDEYRLTSDDLALELGAPGGLDPSLIEAMLAAIVNKLQQGSPSARSCNAKQLEGGRLVVKQARKTFEYELALAELNHDVMLTALRSIHPVIAQNIRQLFSADRLVPEQKAVCIWLAIGKQKAEFAQRLAALLAERNRDGTWQYAFAVPGYISDAVTTLAPVSAGPAKV